MFEGFKVVGVVSCGSVRQNNSVVRCNSVVGVVCKVVVVLWIVWCLVGWVVDGLRGWGMRKRLRGLYPDQNRPICDSILTDLHTLTIHISVYLIPVF